MCQINPVQKLPSYASRIHFKYCDTTKAWAFETSLKLFPPKNSYPCFSSLIRATCPTHLILPNLISLIISGDEKISSIPSLCCLLQSSVTSVINKQYHNDRDAHWNCRRIECDKIQQTINRHAVTRVNTKWLRSFPYSREESMLGE